MRALLDELTALAVTAGARILEMRTSQTGWSFKPDGSPVTDADRVAENIILERLETLDAGTAVVAEERFSEAQTLQTNCRRFYLVDALDGTKEYLNGTDDFTVNIALIEDGIPVLGVVAAPARGEVFAGLAREGAWRSAISSNGSPLEPKQIQVRHCADRWVAVCSASHSTRETQAMLEVLPVGRQISVGSSLKFCLVACGEADFYPRLGRTMQWDTAAGDAIVRAAGGATLVRTQLPLAYGPRRQGTHPFENPEFVVIGRHESFASYLEAAGWGS